MVVPPLSGIVALAVERVVWGFPLGGRGDTQNEPIRKYGLRSKYSQEKIVETVGLLTLFFAGSLSALSAHS